MPGPEDEISYIVPLVCIGAEFTESVKLQNKGEKF